MPQLKLPANCDGEIIADWMDSQSAVRPRGKRPVDTKTPVSYDDKIIAKMPTKCQSIDGVVDYLTENWSSFAKRGITGVGSKLRSRLKSVDIQSIEFDMLSNRDCAPFNGVTNWGGFDKNRPTGYLGYQASLKLQFDNILGVDAYAMFANTAIKIDRSTRYYESPDCIYFGILLFLDDWPLMAENAAIERMLGSNRYIERYYDERANK